MLKHKLFIVLPILVLAIIFVFSLTMIPSINPTPKNLPIAIVNEDKGIDVPQQGKMNMGDLIAKNIQTMSSFKSGTDSSVKWISVESNAKVQEGLNRQDYYAALVIPSDFSTKQASLRTANPVSPNIQLYVNQGMNALASNMAAQILNQVIESVNNKIRTDLLTAIDQKGGTLTTKQAAAIASPIVKQVTNVNAIGTHSASGNAPVSLFQPLWMGSIVGGIVFLFIKRKFVLMTRKEKLQANLLQFIWGVVLSLVAGYSFTWFADLWGLNIQHFNDTALFLSISYLSFFLMISAVLSWIGLAGMAIFMLFLFFGTPLLTTAPELLSTFYQDWILTWLPMNFMVKGLREIFFFGHGLSLNHATIVLIWIGVVSFIVLMASSFKRNAKSELLVEMHSLDS
ncbi:YhgE/Pip domain-containing protein [Paenibacillus shirakamiensis]|uniref:YhgE/Pip domain-containing protein n=1 Tax=Paenibacillus shirakamiensis TaxID=1265935 RepID=UPI001AE8D0D7